MAKHATHAGPELELTTCQAECNDLTALLLLYFLLQCVTCLVEKQADTHTHISTSRLNVEDVGMQYVILL